MQNKDIFLSLLLSLFMLEIEILGGERTDQCDWSILCTRSWNDF